MTVSNEAICKQQCDDDNDCSKWTFYADVESGCYLESELMSEIKDLFSPTATFNSEKPTEKRTNIRNMGSKIDHVSIQHLLSKLITTDSRTTLNFPQHFMKGCSYTISMWVWLWKKQKHEKKGKKVDRAIQNEKESILFSTRQINPETDKYDEILLPAIIFDIMKYPGQFFFSAEKDILGDYSGFSPSYSIKYHEWTHIAMTITNEHVSAYIDGVFQQQVSVNYPITQMRKCLYPSSSNRNISEDANIDKANYVSSNGNNEYNNGENEEDSKYDSTDNEEAVISNTIFQVTGGKNIPSFPGMIQDVTIYRNIALSANHIQQVMKKKPVVNKTLKKLMNLYGIYSLEGYSVREWEDDYYLMIEWGVCPVAVCGHVCFDEKFLLGHVSKKVDNESDDSDSRSTKSKENNQSKNNAESSLIKSIMEYLYVDSELNKNSKIANLHEYKDGQLSNFLDNSNMHDLNGEGVYIDDSGYGYGDNENWSDVYGDYYGGANEYDYHSQYNDGTYDDINLDWDPNNGLDGGISSSSFKKLKSNRMNKIRENTEITTSSTSSKQINAEREDDAVLSDDKNKDKSSNEKNSDSRLPIDAVLRPSNNHSSALFHLPRRYTYSYDQYKHKMRQNFSIDDKLYPKGTSYANFLSGSVSVRTYLYEYICSLIHLYFTHSIILVDDNESLEDQSETSREGRNKAEEIQSQSNNGDADSTDKNDRENEINKEIKMNNIKLNALAEAEKNYLSHNPTGTKASYRYSYYYDSQITRVVIYRYIYSKVEMNRAGN